MIVNSTSRPRLIPLKLTDIKEGLLVIGNDTKRPAILTSTGEMILAVYLDAGDNFPMLSAADVLREFSLLSEGSVLIMVQPKIS